MAKQVKVQTVSELVINQMNAATYFEEKAAGRLKDGEVYVVEPDKQGASVETFYQWLKERNYDLTNFQGLEKVFPVKDFPEIKAANLAGGDTKIVGTGAPNTIVEYDGKRAQVGSDGYFVLDGITPLVDGDLIEITCYDYAGRKKTFSVPVGKFEYAVPEGTTEITKEIVEQYNLNRAGRLVFPASVKRVSSSAFRGSQLISDISLLGCTSVENDTFDGCTALTRVSFPACTRVGGSVFDDCTALTSASFPVCTSVGNFAFWNCHKLQMVVLSDEWAPHSKTSIPTTATVYNPDKTKKVDWKTMKWVNV